MASPYLTKQPVYLEDPSGRFDNILPYAEERLDKMKDFEGPQSRYTTKEAKKKLRKLKSKKRR